jgi:hypothetical protein
MSAFPARREIGKGMPDVDAAGLLSLKGFVIPTRPAKKTRRVLQVHEKKSEMTTECNQK